MAGREKIKVYEYNRKGVLLNSWSCIAEARKFHYPKDKNNRPIFIKKVEGYDLHITPKDTVLLLERPGRELIKTLYKIATSKLCNLNLTKNTNKTVQMFNLKGELIAEFKDLAIARVLLSKEYSAQTAYNQLFNNKQISTMHLEKDFYFKFK